MTAAKWAPLVTLGVLTTLCAFDNGPLSFLPGVIRWPALLALLFFVAHTHVSSVRTWASQFTAGLWPVEALAVTFVTACWLLVKAVGIHASNTDDGIYFYLAQRVAQGAVPYRDFFFAHPPMHLLVPALAFKLFGWSVTLARTLPVLAQTLAALCLWSALRRHDRLLAWVCLTLQFTAAELLESSSDLNGQDLLCLGLAGAFLLVSRGRPGWAGVSAGLGLGCALYGLPVAGTLGVMLLWHERRAGLRYLLGGVGSLTLLCLPAVLMSGGSFFTQVFTYHLLKSASPESVRLTLLKLVHFHSMLWVAAALGLLMLKRMPAGDLRRLVAAATLGVVLSLVQDANLTRLFSFYTAPLVMCLTVPAALAVTHFVRTVASSSLWPLGSLLAFSTHHLLATSLIGPIWPDEVRSAGARVDFVWQGLPVAPALSELTRQAFFIDHRVKGEPTPPVAQFIWHKQQRFSALPELAQWVNSHSHPDETVTGASGYAPLVALESGRRLAADEADTNAMRFQSGLLTDREFWQRVCRDHVRYLVAAPRSHFDPAALQRDPTVTRLFALEHSVDDRQLQFTAPVHLELWRRTDAPCE